VTRLFYPTGKIRDSRATGELNSVKNRATIGDKRFIPRDHTRRGRRHLSGVRRMKATFAFAFTCLTVILLQTFASAQSIKKFDFKKDEPKKELTLHPALTKPLPESLDDLKAIQEQTKKVVDKVSAATVGIQIGGASGSGIIVTKDGMVLTAGHVSGKPGQKCTLLLPDGKRLEGKSLGRNPGIDSGMIQIISEGSWEFCEMGKSEDLKQGQWCIAIGHPNGYQKGRSPVVRLGRILNNGKTALTSDCTLVGGDSGGPLFDMAGKVIGIHSRIGATIASNVHVPINVYTESWDRLVKGDEIGPGGNTVTINAYFGVTRDEEAKDCKLARVTEGSPAEKAGLLAGDVIVKFDGKEVKSYDDLLGILAKKKAGDEVDIIITREGDTKSLKVKLDKRG